jgi:putative two-component system response regulator
MTKGEGVGDDEKPQDAAPDANRRVVLVIDDSPGFLSLASAVLRGKYTVLTAADALDGYALLCQRVPDLVILDVMMPFVDGWTVLRKIRSNPVVARLPVIVVTGLEPEAARHEATRVGVVHLLFKPVLPAQLLSAVETAIGEST